MATSSAGELSGQAAVVTGSSSGIGRAIALELARAGADVLVHARVREEAAREVVTEARRLGVSAEYVLFDLADQRAQDALVERAYAWREIDIWINNAGADVLTGPPAKWSFEEKLDALWKVDVTATLRLGRSVGQRMMRRGNGLILNMGWDQAERGMEGSSGELFAATKGAVMAFTKSLARSLAPHVRVNCLAPGWIRTAWAETASASWQQRAVQENLLGRWGTPEDVAGVCRFLASPAAAFITGQVLAINGGLK
jgi:3-oxoacyl-[acyl-carrier protein] reductase